MKFLIQKIDGKLCFDFCRELVASSEYYKWRDEPFVIKYAATVVPELAHPENYVPVGSVEFVRSYAEKYYPDIKEGLKPLNVPQVLFPFAGRQICNVPAECDREDEKRIISHFRTKNIYVKNNSVIKHPDNGYFDIVNDYNDVENTRNLRGCQLSGIRYDILSEWRVFVYNNKVEQVCYYDGDPLIFPLPDRIQEMVNAYKDTAPVAYTLDVYNVHEAGSFNIKTYVMECHRFFSCGLYGFADYRKLPYMFYREWQEILKLG